MHKWTSLALGLTLAVLATGGIIRLPEPASAATGDPAIVPRPDHTVVVMLENKNRTSVIGSSKAPYLNSLAAQGANLTESYGVTHPSQGNYVALFSGGLQGIKNDSCPKNFPGVDNLGAQLASAGLSFTGYSESLPSVGYTGCKSGDYRRKHNSWVDFPDLPGAVNQPFSAFPTDFEQLPTVAFVTPNMCNDMHDCSVATGDDWMETHLDAYAQWAKTHNSLLVVTFDENSGGTVNQIATLLVGQQVRPGVYDETMDHYSLLRTIEDAYGLPALGQAAETTALQSVWATVAPPVVDSIVNASFEDGSTGWLVSGSSSGAATIRHGGTRSIRVGALKATVGDSILSQTVTVPEGASTLSMAWFGRCHDTIDNAWATIIVKDLDAHEMLTLLPPTCVNGGGWHDVSEQVVAGHKYVIQLVNHDDGIESTPNLTYFDDVALS